MTDLELNALPEKLLEVSLIFSHDTEVNERMKSLVSNCKTVYTAYTSAMQKEGNDVILKRQTLIRTRDPRQIHVEALQISLSNFKTSMNRAAKIMTTFEKSVHLEIEYLREKALENQSEINRLRSRQKKLFEEIQTLQARAKELETAMRATFERAEDKQNTAIQTVERSKDAATAGVIGGVVGVVAGFALAPFSGGLSLVASGVGAAMSVTSTATSVGLAVGASKIQDRAKEEMDDGKAIMKKIEDLYKQINQIVEEVKVHQKKEIQLKQATSKLVLIEQCLHYSIKKMYETEVDVQNLEMTVKTALLHGESFEVVQRALDDCSHELLFKEANSSMVQLKGKWKTVQSEIVNMCERM